MLPFRPPELRTLPLTSNLSQVSAGRDHVTFVRTTETVMWALSRQNNVHCTGFSLSRGINRLLRTSFPAKKSRQNTGRAEARAFSETTGATKVVYLSKFAGFNQGNSQSAPMTAISICNATNYHVRRGRRGIFNTSVKLCLIKHLCLTKMLNTYLEVLNDFVQHCDTTLFNT